MTITEIDDGPVKPEPESKPTKAATPTPTPTGDAPVDAIMQALLDRISPITEAPIYFKGLIYGPPGAGKTTFAGEAEDVLVIDVEQGTQSLLNHATTQHASVLEFRSFTQIEYLIDKLGKGAFPQFKCLVLDSGTTLQELTLDAIVKKASSEDASRNPFVPQLQDYNANTNQMRRIMSMLKALPMHVIVIAQAKEVKDESTGRLLMRPAFTDKLSTSLNHLFSTVGYLTVDPDGNRQLQVHPTDKITAKTRIGGLPGVIKNPNINTLINANSATKDN